MAKQNNTFTSCLGAKYDHLIGPVLYHPGSVYNLLVCINWSILLPILFRLHKLSMH